MIRPFDVPPRANHAGKLRGEVVMRRVWWERIGSDEILAERMRCRDKNV
jgi:hypothetical protein